MPVAQFKEISRGLIGKIQIENLEIFREIDPGQSEYRTTVSGTPTGVSPAVFKDGRGYRVIDAG